MKLKKSYTIRAIQKRLLTFIMLITFIFCVLAGRLAYVQLVQGRELQSKAADQWMRELPVTPARGKITDVNGKLLVSDYTTYSVYVRPRAVKDANAAAALLSSTLEMDKAKLYDKIKKGCVSEITIKKQVEKPQADALKTAGLDGIYLSEDAKRSYIYGDFLTQVLGYTNIDGEGQEGLEKYYNKYLMGTKGYSLTQTDIRGEELSSNVTQYIPAIPGCDVKLTVDYYIQSFAERAVENVMKQYNPLNASAIVMDAQTGGVLAMTTKNSFDLNDPPRDDVARLMALSKNKMIVDVYEPGSTFKIFTTAAAVEENKVRMADRFYCPGHAVYDGQRIKCWRTIGHGSEDFQQGVNSSCNIVFMALAQRLGTKTFYEYLNKFGFGAVSGIDAYSESRGILLPEKTVKTVDLVRIGFGQTIAVTPLQMVAGVGAVVNGGKLMQPRLVKEITDYSGKVVQLYNPVERRGVLSERASASMREILETAVRVGSGKNCYIEGYKIGGKTGTAQKYKDGVIDRGKYISSFIGFAPADNPKYVVLVTVDEPQGYLYYGSIVAAPAVKEIFQGIFTYKDIKPDLATKAKELSVPDVEMPFVLGMSVTDAILALEAAGLQYEIEGEEGRIAYQFPPAGTKLRPGSVVLLALADAEI